MRTATALLGAAAAALLAPLPASATPATPTVTLTATYTDTAGSLAGAAAGTSATAATGRVAGETAGSADAAAATAGGAGTFTYTATCTMPDGAACTAAGNAARVTWTMSADGTPETPVPAQAGTANSAGTTSRTFSSAGTRPVSVTVDVSRAGQPGVSATATMLTFVSPRYADVNAATSGAQNIWTASAAGLIGPCTNWALDPTAGFTAVTGSTVGEAYFCPSPPVTPGASPTIGSPNYQPAPARSQTAVAVVRNGVSWALCLPSPGGCGLPTGATSANTGGTTGIPGVTASGMAYQRNWCADNVAEVNAPAYTFNAGGVGRGGYMLARGVEPDCASVHTMLSGLVSSAGPYATLPPNSLPAVPVTTMVSNAVTNPTFTAATGWTGTGGATVTADAAGGYATVPSGGSMASTLFAAGAGLPTDVLVTAASPGAKVTVTVNFFTAASQIPFSYAETSTVISAEDTADTRTVIRLPAIAPYGTAQAQVRITSAGADTRIRNVTAARNAGADTATLGASAAAPLGADPAGAAQACPAGPAPDTVVRRAVGLYGSVVPWCSTDQALTRATALALLAAAAGWTPTGTPPAYQDVTAGSDTAAAAAAVSAHGALPASWATACTGGTCLSPNTTLTRTDLAGLLAGAVGAGAPVGGYTPAAAGSGARAAR